VVGKPYETPMHRIRSCSVFSEKSESFAMQGKKPSTKLSDLDMTSAAGNMEKGGGNGNLVNK